MSILTYWYRNNLKKGLIEALLFYISQLGKQIISIGGDKKTQLIDNTGAFSGSASPIRLRASGVTKCLPKADKYLSATGEDSYIDITERGTYHIQYSNYTNSTSDKYQYSYSDWSWEYDYDTKSGSTAVKDSYDMFVGTVGTDIGNWDPNAYVTAYYYYYEPYSYTYSYRYRDYYYDYAYSTYYYYYGTSANYYKYYYRDRT